MALPTLTLSDASREKLHTALVPVRHAFFWAEWAFRLLFVGPATWLCLALALSSHFSFEKLASDTLQVIATMERNPAPPAVGSVMLGVCNDHIQNAPGQIQKPRPVCETPGWEQTSIKAAASTASAVLWKFYAFVVLITAALYIMTGLFDRSRQLFLASLETSRAGIRIVNGRAGASNEASI
jgi:hypothetical protein